MAKAEYVRALYCDVTDYEPVQGGREETGGMVRTAVVVEGGNGTDMGKGDVGDSCGCG